MAEPERAESSPKKLPHVPFNEQQQQKIIAALFRREDNKTIITDYGVSERQLRRITHNLKTHGTFHPPSTKKMGRPTCLNKEVEEDLKQYVAAQPLALLVDMQKYVQDKYNIKCSRASLSRRIREMGYTRAIIKRGFRAEDQHVPAIAPEDMLRIMSGATSDDDPNDLPGNAKRARYAWLLHSTTPPTKPAAKKQQRKKTTEGTQGQPGPNANVDPAIMQSPSEQSHPGHGQALPPNGYAPAPLYMSSYRQANGGLVVSGHPMGAGQAMGSHISPEASIVMGLQ